MDWSSHLPAFILSFQLLIGGQARLPISPTPSIRQITLDQSAGFKEALYFIPLDQVDLMEAIGWALITTAAMVAWPQTRSTGAVFSALISLTFFYVHATMGESNVLPAINFLLAGLIWRISQ